MPSPSTMYKVTYSTDTTTRVATAALSASRYGTGATGNSTSGYFGGGVIAPSSFSTMDKLDYSTEVTSRIPGASLSAARYGLAASSSTGNALSQQDITATPQAIQGDTGYFGGGAGARTGLYQTEQGIRRLSINESKSVMGFNLNHLVSDGLKGYQQLGNAVIPRMIGNIWDSIKFT